jgi:hypothetical protein
MTDSNAGRPISPNRECTQGFKVDVGGVRDAGGHGGEDEVISRGELRVQDEQSQAGEDVEEARRPKVPKTPCKPSQREIDEHYATHLPFRDWCPCCTRGKKKNPNHTLVPAHEREVEEVHVDQCFLENLKSLVMRGRNTRATFSDVVLYKGRGREGPVERVQANLRKLGHKRIIIRTDQEPALINLAKAAKEARAEAIGLEHSPAGESQSNGLVERATQTVEEQVRTYKLGLEQRIQSSIPNDHPSVTWLVQHAGDCIAQVLVGRDRKTALERLLGEPCREEIFEFGERICYKVRKGQAGKLSPTWGPGIWLGKRWATHEHYVSTDARVIKCRAVHRRPNQDKWSGDEITKVKGLSWDMNPREHDQDNPLCVLPPLDPTTSTMHPPAPAEEQENAPESFRILKSDLDRWGYAMN